MGFIKDPIHKGNAYKIGVAVIDSHRVAAAPFVAAQEIGLTGFDGIRWDPMGVEGIR